MKTYRQTLVGLIAIIVLIFTSTSLRGQVLTPPSKLDARQTKQIKVEGVVSDQKKYSFTIRTKKGNYEIKPQPNAVFSLRLNKPIFDFPTKQVRVQKPASMFAPKLEESKQAASRVTLDLPDKLYVISRFENERQMRRIMDSKVKRINNYLLTSENTGDIVPSAKQLLIAGQLLPETEATVARLEIGEDSYSVMLGHRRGFLTGFSIADMKPLETEVFIWGNLEADNSLSAHRIEFRPIKQ